MRFFSEEKVNKGRQPELDWLKAACILMMIMLHVYDDCADEPGGLLYSFFDYACTFLGAGAFMICMGVGMRYSRKQDPKDYIHRGIEILTVGQFLNLLRNALPNLIAWWATGKNIFIAQSLLVFQADILTFAGLAFMLIALLKYLKASDGCILAIGIAMNIAAIPIHDYMKMPENYLAGQFAGFFVLPAFIFFPGYGKITKNNAKIRNNTDGGNHERQAQEDRAVYGVSGNHPCTKDPGRRYGSMQTV